MLKKRKNGRNPEKTETWKKMRKKHQKYGETMDKKTEHKKMKEERREKDGRNMEETWRKNRKRWKNRKTQRKRWENMEPVKQKWSNLDKEAESENQKTSLLHVLLFRIGFSGKEVGKRP